MKRQLHRPKLGTFWIPVLLFAFGVLLNLSRFFENPLEEYVPHLAGISFVLVVIAFILVWLGF